MIKPPSMEAASAASKTCSLASLAPDTWFNDRTKSTIWKFDREAPLQDQRPKG